MREFLEEAKNQGKINDGFDIENYFFIAIHYFHYSEKEFLKTTPKKILSLMRKLVESRKQK